LRAPTPDKIRVKVLAAPVSKPDVEARYGHSPFAPSRIPFVTKSFPFVPSYAIVGVVDAIEAEVTDIAEDDQVATIGLGLIAA
jgi:NADPH:quinone reductase-like Zn-dependent oxidoreductase